MTNKPVIDIRPLKENWRMVRSAPFSASGPDDVDWANVVNNAIVPGTVASTLLGSYDPDRHPDLNYDDFDWWYECAFDINPADYCSTVLHLDGLATIAEIWLNGKSIHKSRNMFRAYKLDIKNQLAPTNTLSIVFRSISHDLKTKRPRGRWKTNLITNQQLRWVRTTLLGRIAGWTPPIQPVGPWRDIRLVGSREFTVDSVSVFTTAEKERARIHVNIELANLGPAISISDTTITILKKVYPLTLQQEDDKATVTGSIDIVDIPFWAPRDCGGPHLHEYSIVVTANGKDHTIKSGKLGVRSATLDRRDRRLVFVINGQELFACGGCWSSNDIVSLNGHPEKLRRILTLTCEAGGNMIRVGGTMVYEADLFYDLCDELGITVWQDFMFANMDYPFSDDKFRDDVKQEVQQQLMRLREHPCIIAFCGNSEVEQQAAMFGMTEAVWRNDQYYSIIPELVEKASPGMLYFPSSPCDGPLPFHNSDGPSHYFGIGAYKRPFSDLYESNVKFATECLAFSNMPSDEFLKTHFGTIAPVTHHPRWKAGVPRDSSAGWDFEDIRDHYLKDLLGIDAVDLRYYDKERYVSLSQTITGELMEDVYNFWRHENCDCSGALIWFLNDLVPGAGWGCFDFDGQPKPLYYSLKRCWSDVRLSFRDRGMDGLDIVIANDSKSTLKATLGIQVLQNSRICTAEASEELSLHQSESQDWPLDKLLQRFYDTAFRYRFGPPKHDVILATLRNDEQALISVAAYLPNPHNTPAVNNPVITVRSDSRGGEVRIIIRSDAFLQYAKLTSDSLAFRENFFHVPPNTDVSVTASRTSTTDRRIRCTLSARNIDSSQPFTVEPST